MNFSDSKYKLGAQNIKNELSNIHSFDDAFFMLIKDLPTGEISNLVLKLQKFYESMGIKLLFDDCYELTQSVENLDYETKRIIVDLALQCLEDGINIGEKTNEQGINTSSWIKHCLYSSVICEILAKPIGLDLEIAKTYGLLHDYGRKYDHSFNHVISGFEKLYDLGWEREAISCLTHSFLNGQRCANNEPAVDGFKVSSDGDATIDKNVYNDDILEFLENYEYTGYDLILNMADLMATSEKIVSPYDRITDIASRREIDPKNRAYFFIELSNLLNQYMILIGYLDNFEFYKCDSNMTIELADKILKETSDVFVNCYQSLIEKSIEKK